MQNKFIESIDCRMSELLYEYIRKHSKALIVRFDVHYPKHYLGPAKNTDISVCMAYVVKKYTRQGVSP